MMPSNGATPMADEDRRSQSRTRPLGITAGGTDTFSPGTGRTVPDDSGLPPRFSLEEAGDGLSVCDPEGIIVFVNERLRAMAGAAEGEMVGRPAEAFLTAAWEEGRGDSDAVTGSGNRAACSGTLRRKDGSSLAISLDRNRLIDSSGRLLGTLDVIMDVGKKARLEQTLHVSADWQSLIVDNLNDVFWAAEVEGVERRGKPAAESMGPCIDARTLFQRWRFTYVSPSFQRVLGYSLPDPTQLRPYEAVPSTVHDEVNRHIMAAVEQAMSTPDGASLPNDMVLPFITATGEPCWCDTTARVLYDEERKLLRFVGVTRDVTRAHRVEETLRASEARLRAICEAAQDAVVVIDGDGRAIHWNPAAERMFGYRGEEVLGRNMHELLAPEKLREKIRRGVEHFQHSGEGPVVGNVIQSTAIRRDGSEFPVEVAVSPIQVDGRRAAVGVIRDITERTMAEEAVRREQRRLAQLLDVYEGHRKVATYEIHDGVTQPLVSTLMTLDAFSAVRDCCPTAQWRSFDAAVAMLREALAETRRFMSGMRPHVLDQLGVVSALEHLIREHRVSGTAEIEYDCQVTFERLAPPLETAVFRIVQEGLVNAQRHSRSKRVLVEFRQQEDRVQVLVQDWGVGFDPGRVGPDRFGLEGIRERAAALGGQARVISKPGEGTRVEVDLPLLVERPAEE